MTTQMKMLIFSRNNKKEKSMKTQKKQPLEIVLFNLLGRSIFVMDRNGIIQYIQNVKELSQEPDYDAVLAAVQKLV